MIASIMNAKWENIMEKAGLEKQGSVETDQLTGCLTLGSFRDIVSRDLKHTPGKRDESVILYFNIEGFKSYNERYGFERGNEVIAGLADLLMRVFPDHFISRTGGDQFTVFASEKESIDGIENVNESFPAVCQGMPLDLRSGIFRLDGQDIDVATACDRAKIAADSIRKQYGVHYRYFDNELNQSIVKQRYIIQNIDRAIEHDNIKVYYQPVVRTLTGEVCGVEALARWDDAVYGLMAPDILINTLEEYHLIHKLDSFMIRKVCRDYAYSRRAEIPLVPVSFNLSRLDFELCDIYSVIEEAVTSNRIPKDMIHIEITESVFTRNPEFIKEPIRRFHEAGYQVWMDDFGSGYSSLNILKDYDFDLIKIDMLFLRRFNQRSREIITAIVDMAKRIGIRTLAEGVETKEQLSFLKSVGCEKAQGYLIDRPEPYHMMLDHLKNLGYEFEDLDRKNYYDDLGKVNLLSTKPLEFNLSHTVNDPAETETQGIPIAIYEFHGSEGHFLLANDSFRALLDGLGIPSVEHARSFLNNPGTPLYEKLRSYAKQLQASGGIASIDTIVNGNYCLLQARLIAQYQGGSCFLATLMNLSGNFGFTKKEKMNEVLPLLYTAYEMVDIVYPEEDRDELVYSSAERYTSEAETASFREKVRRVNIARIHHDDRGRYLKFMNPDDMWERLKASETGILDDYFRSKTGSGRYCWVQAVLSIAKNDRTHRVLFCLRRTESDKLTGYMEPDIGSITPHIVKDLKYLSAQKDELL